MLFLALKILLDFTVTYHNSPADALSGADPILNTSLYENNTPNLETSIEITYFKK